MPQNKKHDVGPLQTELAELLAEARRDVKQIPTLRPDLVPPTAEQGYAVNRLVAARLGWDTLGWKIAGTTAAVRDKLSITGPIYGRTYRRFATPSPARFRHAELLDPLVECEFFVTLAGNLPPRDEPWTMAEVAAAVGTVHAGIEVAECRFPMPVPPLPAVFADGSASGRYVFGGLLQDWQAGLADVAVTLEVDGVVRRRGTGADVMGDPLQPLLWLAEELRGWGEGLRAGETISTGSTTGMLAVRAGQQVRAVFAEQAEVRITFDE